MNPGPPWRQRYSHADDLSLEYHRHNSASSQVLRFTCDPEKTHRFMHSAILWDCFRAFCMESRTEI